MQRRRRPKPPIIDGEPSPSAAKIGRMNIADLEAHIARLKTEAGHLERRIGHLAVLQPPREEQVAQLQAQLARLHKLVGLAEDQLKIKHQRKQEWEARGGSRGGPRGGGGGYGGYRGGGRRRF